MQAKFHVILFVTNRSCTFAASGIENAASRYPLRVQISKEKIKQSLLNLKPQAKAKSKRVNQQLPTTNETKGAVDSESEKNPADKAAKIQGEFIYCNKCKPCCTSYCS